MSLNKHKQAGNFYYCPHDILGSGTWGTVYKAKNINDHSDDGKEYALKKINKFKIDSS
jgi:serine/threonine protein kinase